MEIGVECWAIPAIDLVNSEVRGTTLQKLIVDSEVRGTTLQKLIVDNEVRGTTLQKLIASEVKVKVKCFLVFKFQIC